MAEQETEMSDEKREAFEMILAALYSGDAELFETLLNGLEETDRNEIMRAMRDAYKFLDAWLKRNATEPGQDADKT